MSIDSIKNEIITKLKQIGQLKEAKKQHSKSYNEDINALQDEIDAKLVELEESERADLEEGADQILEDSDA